MKYSATALAAVLACVTPVLVQAGCEHVNQGPHEYGVCYNKLGKKAQETAAQIIKPKHYNINNGGLPLEINLGKYRFNLQGCPVESCPAGCASLPDMASVCKPESDIPADQRGPVHMSAKKGSLETSPDGSPVKRGSASTRADSHLGFDSDSEAEEESKNPPIKGILKPRMAAAARNAVKKVKFKLGNSITSSEDSDSDTKGGHHHEITEQTERPEKNVPISIKHGSSIKYPTKQAAKPADVITQNGGQFHDGSHYPGAVTGEDQADQFVREHHYN